MVLDSFFFRCSENMFAIWLPVKKTELLDLPEIFNHKQESPLQEVGAPQSWSGQRGYSCPDWRGGGEAPQS